MAKKVSIGKGMSVSKSQEKKVEICEYFVGFNKLVQP